MRICIDVQGMQTGSRFRGIGRWTQGLVRGMLRNKGEHEIFLIINGELEESAFAIRKKFQDLLPDDHFIEWHVPAPLAFRENASSLNRHDASSIYQYAVLTCAPDVLLLPSPIEGSPEEFFWDVSEIKKYCLICVVIHDFIPAENPKKYLGNPIEEKYYRSKLKELYLADVFFTNSEYTALKTEERFSGIPVLNISSGADEAFRPVIKNEEEWKHFLSLHGISKHIIFYAGGTDDRKNVGALLEAYALLPNEVRASHQLVVACGKNEAAYHSLTQKKNQLSLTDEDCILLGYISDEELIAFYSRCSLFVFPSFEEGFGLPVLEAMKCGSAAVCSNRTSLPEVLGYDEGLFDPDSPEDICRVMEKYLTDNSARELLLTHCNEQAKKFSWDITARRVLDFEYASLPAKKVFEGRTPEELIQLCAEQILEKPHTDEQMMALSKKLASTFLPRKKKFYFDIHTLAQNDAGTGIQKVTKMLLCFLDEKLPADVELIPIYWGGDYYRCASRYRNRTQKPLAQKNEYVVDWRAGDILFLPEIVKHHLDAAFFRKFMDKGVLVYAILYDLIPVKFPHYCAEGIAGPFANEYLPLLSTFNGIIADSRSAADDYREWKKANIPDSGKPFLIDWFHLGADLEKGLGTTGIPADSAPVFEAMKARPSLLEVSTVEPRKGHKQTLAAFEQLWGKGVEANFVIVGKPGWKMDDFFKRVEQHPEFGRRLFWLKGISDEYLNAVYEAASGVIMPSEAEGFGLAVIEGAHHGKPLILRDIPVFREIAGNNATYFSGLEPEPLAECLELWLEDFKRGSVIPSTGIRPLTWAESAQMLLQRLGLATSENPSKD